MNLLFDREGNEIVERRWKTLVDLPGYCIVRRFRSPSFWASASWNGVGSKPFTVSAQGHGETKLGTEKEAISLYEHIIVTLGHAEWINNGGHIIVHGNELPCPGEQKNALRHAEEMTKMADCPEYGSW